MLQLMIPLRSKSARFQAQHDLGTPGVLPRRGIVRKLHVAPLDSPNYQRPLYCRYARVDCKSDPLPARGLLRN
jgi:hypothetical protein